MLGGDGVEQAALLCPGKGTEGEDGPGRMALNQSREEEEKKRHKKAGRGARKKPSGSLWRASHAPGLPRAPTVPGPLTAKGTAPRPSRLAPSFTPGPTQRKGRRSEASNSAASWFK